MSAVENKLKHMTTRAQDTSKLKNENDMLYKTIESLKEQIKEKDDILKKSQLDYQKILGELATQHSDNRRIMKIAKRSDMRFSRRRTISDLDSFKDDLRSAENTEKQLKSEAKSWGKRAESMRNLLGENHNSLQENDEDSIKESSSESSDDSSIVCSGVLRKQSESQAVLSSKDKVMNSLTVKKKGNKEINVYNYNIQKCAHITVNSKITNRNSDEDSGSSNTPAIEESSE
ncbi:uncharacterized protein LOC134696636 [Mytilus trossulus]|uniref:uncharacterized protein LOC134696636 n=1 Tax=Mytilus trossulus TaxID=6551 RepID=UPI003007556C